MACNRVIVNSVEINSQYAQMFKDNNMGISVDNADYEGFANAIRMLFQSPEQREKMARNANNFGKEQYSSKNSIALLVKVLEKISKPINH